LAGLSNDASAEIDPELTKAINYKGSERFAREAKKAGVARYIYASSASVYGAVPKLHCPKMIHYIRKLNMQKQSSNRKSLA
jgi:nucleoside-diphosphate-sugar epimerase